MGVQQITQERDSSGSGKNTCEQGNEPYVSIQDVAFIDQLGDSQLLSDAFEWS